MGALADEDPPYRLEYTVASSGRRVEVTLRRGALRADVNHYAGKIATGAIVGMKSINRHGEDVTVDWFG